MTDVAPHLNTPTSTEFDLTTKFRRVRAVHIAPLAEQYQAAIMEAYGSRQPDTTRTQVNLALTGAEQTRTQPLRGLNELLGTRSAADLAALTHRIAPTARAREQFIAAEDLIGALYGPERQAVWMTTELSALGRTPLEYLETVGPRGWTQILHVLEGLMQGGSDSSQADRDWATERLAGHKLQIRR